MFVRHEVQRATTLLYRTRTPLALRAVQDVGNEKRPQQTPPTVGTFLAHPVVDGSFVRWYRMETRMATGLSGCPG